MVTVSRRVRLRSSWIRLCHMSSTSIIVLSSLCARLCSWWLESGSTSVSRTLHSGKRKKKKKKQTRNKYKGHAPPAPLPFFFFPLFIHSFISYATYLCIVINGISILCRFRIVHSEALRYSQAFLTRVLPFLPKSNHMAPHVIPHDRRDVKCCVV